MSLQRSRKNSLVAAYLDPLIAKYGLSTRQDPESSTSEPKDAEEALYDAFEDLGCGEGVRVLARNLLEGKPTNNPEIDCRERLDFFFEWLKFVQSDSSLARRYWEWLAQTRDRDLWDRDRYVLQLWQRILHKDNFEAGLIGHAQKFWGPWSFYERHFFGWFLSRFHLRAARRVFADVLLPGLLNVLLAGLTFSLAFNYFQKAGTTLSSAWGWSILFMVIALAASPLLARKVRAMYAYAHSLIPRLAATVGIGYLFLASAPHLMQVIHDKAGTAAISWYGSGVLLLAAQAFLMLHISRRVHPALDFGALFVRALDVLALAVSYTLLGLVTFAPLLFSRTFLEVEGGDSVEAAWHELALTAAIALNLGVILQLAWDEKPLTEPL